MDYTDTEEYILLQFKERVDHKFLNKPNLVFKIIKFETECPLIQIGKHVFKAQFEKELLGTILLFDEQSELRPTDVTENDTPIHLEYFGKVLKRFTMHWRKTPEKTLIMDEKEYVDLDFRFNYESTLDLIRIGGLKIDDAIKKPVEEPPPSPVSDTPEELPEQSESSEESCDSSDNEIIEEPKKQLDEDSPIRVLQEFVRQPVRDPQYYDYLEGNSFATDREFYILKEIYMKSINYDRVRRKMKRDAWSHLIDIKASMEEGVIEKKAWDEVNDDDIQKMLSFSNFHNLSVDMKILILTDYLKQEKQMLKKLTTLESLQVDKYGRTRKQRYKLIKSFVEDLQYNIYVKNIPMKFNHNYNKFLH